MGLSGQLNYSRNYTSERTFQREEIWSRYDAKGVRPNSFAAISPFHSPSNGWYAGYSQCYDHTRDLKSFSHFLASFTSLLELHFTVHTSMHTLIGSSSPSRLLKANETSNNYRLRRADDCLHWMGSALNRAN